MNWPTFFDPDVSARLCLTLLHSLWQVALLAVATGLIARLGRQTSVERSYALHVGALVLCLAAMPLTYLFMDTPSTTPAASGDHAHQAAPSPTTVAIDLPVVPAPGVPSGQQQIAGPLPDARAVPATEPAATPAWAPLWPRAAPWLAVAYAGGVLLMLARLMAGVIRAERLRRSAEPITQGAVCESLKRLSSQWSLRVVPVLAQAEQIVVPTVVGLLRPTILLPASALSGLSVAELEMILAHELAHVRRHDLWVHLLERLAEVLLFFNPALRYLNRQIGSLREYCCDELACGAMSAGGGVEPRTRYAAALVRVVELSAPAGSADRQLAALAAAGRSPSQLRRRLARLFGEPVREPIRLSRSALATMIAIALLLVIISPIAQSQSDPVESDGNESQTLTFPTDRAVGVVYSRPDDFSGFGYQDDRYGGWEQVGPAWGKVSLPAAHHIRLDVSKAASSDLRFLGAIDPDAVRYLNLKGTDLNDDQLQHVGRLTGLRFVNLEKTRITDRGFQHLANLTRVERLDLSAFRVHREGFGVGDGAMAVVARLPALESIALRLTKVTDAGMAALAKCRSLRAIGIEGTWVTDSGLESLRPMPNLYSLSLGVYDEGANITDEGLKILGRMSQLRHLTLSGAPITDDGLVHLSPLQQLESLAIENTQVTTDGLRHLAVLSSLKHIRAYQLADGSITDEGARHLARIPSLVKITAGLEVTDNGVKELARLSQLEHLDLDGDGERITNEAIKRLTALKQLKELSLSNCNITPEALAHLADLPVLEDLTISRRGLDANGLKHLQAINSLKFLRLHFGREKHHPEGFEPSLKPLAAMRQLTFLTIDGEGIDVGDLESISKLTRLETLNLGDSIVLDDESIRHLASLRSLTSLNIDSSVVSDKGLFALSGMDKLKYLTISCLATDEGLQALHTLKSLRALQIASPYITEDGLAALTGAMPSLQDLNRFTYRLYGTPVAPVEKEGDNEGNAENALPPDPNSYYYLVPVTTPLQRRLVADENATAYLNLNAKALLTDVGKSPDIEIAVFASIEKALRDLPDDQLAGSLRVGLNFGNRAGSDSQWYWKTKRKLDQMAADVGFSGSYVYSQHRSSKDYTWHAFDGKSLKQDRSEHVIEIGRVRIYPVQTALSRFLSGGVDCYIDVPGPLPLDAPSIFSVENIPPIRKAIESLQLEQPNKVRLSVTLDTPEWEKGLAEGEPVPTTRLPQQESNSPFHQSAVHLLQELGFRHVFIWVQAGTGSVAFEYDKVEKSANEPDVSP